MLISHHRIVMRSNSDVGRYLVCGADIRSGELVMLLPPNMLLWEEEVSDFNTCLQARAKPHPPLLHLHSISRPASSFTVPAVIHSARELIHSARRSFTVPASHSQCPPCR